MKKNYFLVVVLFVVGSVRGQNPDDIVVIPDNAFKTALLNAKPWNTIARNLSGNYFQIDANNDLQIDESEASQVSLLQLYYNGIYDLTGIASFVNIKHLSASNNNISSLDLSGLTNLEYLFIGSNYLNSLNVSGCTSLITLSGEASYIASLNTDGCVNLKTLICSSALFTTVDLSSLINLEILNCNGCSMLTTIDVSNLIHLKKISITGSQLTTLDVSNLTELEELGCLGNQLTSVFIKNGISEGYVNFSNNPDLNYICADESQIADLQFLTDELGYNCEISSYCSFTPGGTFYNINGNNKFDNNSNGCDASDLSLTSLKFNITNGAQTGSIIPNQSGEYSIPVYGGTHIITPILENTTYFNISPSTLEVTFPETTSPFTQNFCITPNGIHPDLEVVILPTTPARPGFDADYRIIIKNKGNIQQSGSVSFAYDDAVLDYIIAEPLFTTQAEGLLSWAFADLQPFETREINLTLNVNSPMETPAVNGDDVLTYTATITSEATDELPLDNTFTLPQIVVNSFDPNDKTCLEGTAITPDMIGKYVHYMIRFENTGTFAAENIVVKDMIDTAKFDVSSLVALNGSHPYVTRITGNKVEFIFENINLPFEDATNDGYVVFKIKTLPTLALGDSFSNTASIYFDFNHPIVTEPAVTTFAVLGAEDFVFNNYFTLYPNPTNGILSITSKQAIELQSISIYNVLGQMVVSVPNAKGVSNVDVSSLSTGNYFIKVVSDKGTSNAKFIKQ